MSQANVSLLLRRDTAAHWESINPILKQGEPGYNLTTRELKIGDGIHTWTELRTIKCSDLICRTTAEWASDLNYVLIGSGTKLKGLALMIKPSKQPD